MTSIAPTNSNENAQKNAVAKKALGQQASAEQNITYGGLIEEYHDPFVARFAIKAGAIAVVGFLAWSANAPVHELAVGQGAIYPQDSSKSFSTLKAVMSRKYWCRKAKLF